jgi:uncharacterized surface protein with fasciclin (FAS1) repeats
LRRRGLRWWDALPAEIQVAVAAAVTKADVMASNGVIHLINKVLIP